ncbi:MAG: hypothetical protein M3P30_15215, partial [Chloroflexota bacterium]|nr:hypothetical protein [Chloroflexota bacterium]
MAAALAVAVAAGLVVTLIAVGRVGRSDAKGGLALDSCGYPVGATGRPATVFNESEVLRGFAQTTNPDGSGTIQAFYNDEHALTLGT